MTRLTQVNTLQDGCIDIDIPDGESTVINAAHLTRLPALIDAHVHFRVPGQDYKEDWTHAVRAAFHGGYSCVFDMPNNIPACVSKARLQDKIALIETQLAAADLPLKYELYLGADKNHFDAIDACRDLVCGLKVFMGSSTGDLLMDDESSLHAAFALGAAHDLVVAVHAEDEEMIQARMQSHSDCRDFCCHSIIRSPEVAAAAVKQALSLAKLYGTKLHILHVSTSNELALIREAKAQGIRVSAETTPHHLFLNTDAYASLGAKAQVNPPLREAQHQLALFNAIKDGTIDTLGSDHAPHTLDEKALPYGQAPSGLPGIETNLPLLLNAVAAGQISLSDVVRLTHTRAQEIFDFQAPNHWVLVDLNKQQTVSDAGLKTKCAWSPFADWLLSGWPQFLVTPDRLYDLTQI